MIRLVLVDGLLVVWLIYGNKLYYSKANDCASNKRTQFLSELMGCILYVGYLMIFIYFLILCTVPCLFMYVRHIALELNLQNQEAARRRLTESQIPDVLASLSRVPFSEEAF